MESTFIHMELVLRVVNGGSLAVDKEFAVKGDYKADLPNLTYIQQLLTDNCQCLSDAIQNIRNY